MLAGIKAYQKDATNDDAPKLTPIWRLGEVSLLSLAEMVGSSAPPVLLISSMINRPDILNLTADRSLMRWIADHGWNPIVLDWGESCDDPDQGSLETIVKQRLTPAMQFVSRETRQSVGLFGHCMGGTLALALAAMTRDKLRFVMTMAAPWDFNTGKSHFEKAMSTWGGHNSLNRHKDVTKDRIPAEWIQTFFGSLNPDGIVHKYSRFSALIETDPSEAALFVRVEDWLNNGRDIPADLAHECIQEWYIRNTPINKNWRIGEKIVDLNNITVPILLMAAKKDHLVPVKSIMALKEQSMNADLIQADTGHIGLIAGRQAIENVWQPMAAWMDQHKDA